VSTSSSAGPAARDRDRLSDQDKDIIDQANHLAGLSGPAVVRAYFGTSATSYRNTTLAYAEVLSQATWVIGELLAIVERLADAGPEALTDCQEV
jgi:hypothetical protein